MSDIPEEALILVGGLGSRLGEITKRIPKPMLEVQGKPFLEWTLLWLKAQGVRRFILAMAHQSHVIRNHFKDGEAWGVEVVYSDPDGRQMGTAGSIKEAENLIRGEHFFALNGDVRLEADLRSLYHRHRACRAVATLALAQVPNSGRYGGVRLGAECRIEAFLEKNKNAETGWINGGIYVFSRALFDLMESGRHYSLELDIFPKLAGSALWGVEFPGAVFLDIGTPEDYQKAQAMDLKWKGSERDDG